MTPEQIGRAVSQLLAIFLEPSTLAVLLGVYFAMRWGRRAFGRWRWWHHAAPLLPESICVGLFASGVVPGIGVHPLLVRIALGFVAAYLVQKFHKILGQTVLGDDKALTELFARKRGMGDEP